MATELAKAYVQILPTTKGMTNNLRAQMDAPAAAAGSSAGIKIGSAIKKAIISIGIGTAIKSAVTEGMDLEQNLGGTEVVFGEFARNIQETAKTAYKNMGTSASEYMSKANVMASLFQGSGISQAESLDLTTKAMQRAADVASVMGIDTSMALESIAGAAKGNFTMMDNLGVAMNATTLSAYALEKGINFDWNTASNAEKAQLAMQMFFERTEQYAGNFARESEETLSGSMGAVKSALKNVLGNMALGEDIAPSLNALSTTIVNFAKNLIPTVKNVVTQLPTAFVTVLSGLGPIIKANLMPTLQAFTDPDTLQAFFSAGMELLQGISNGLVTGIPSFLAQALPMLSSFTAQLHDNIGLLVDAGMQTIIALADGLIAALPDLIAYVPDIVINIANTINDNAPKLLETAAVLIWKLITGLIQNIPNIIANMGKIIEAIISVIAAVNWVEKGSAVIRKIGDGLRNMASGLRENAAETIRGMLDYIKSIPQLIHDYFDSKITRLEEIGGNLVKGLWNGIGNKVGWILDKIRGFGRSVLNGIKSVFGIHSPSTETAWMGEMLDRGLANGVAGNLQPIKSAMRKVVAATTGDLESRISLRAGADIAGSAGTSDKSMASILYALQALIGRLSDLKVVLDSGEVVGWVDTGLGRIDGKKARGVT